MENLRMARAYSLKKQKEQLKSLGPYTLKCTSVGWFVDGRCGFQVCGYFDHERDAVISAIFNIEQAKNDGRSPSWLY
jgi:hypothetical protein